MTPAVFAGGVTDASERRVQAPGGGSRGLQDQGDGLRAGADAGFACRGGGHKKPRKCSRTAGLRFMGLRSCETRYARTAWESRA